MRAPEIYIITALIFINVFSFILGHIMGKKKGFYEGSLSVFVDVMQTMQEVFTKLDIGPTKVMEVTRTIMTDKFIDRGYDVETSKRMAEDFLTRK